MRTGFHKHLVVARAPFAHLIQGHAGADVGDVDLRAQVFGEIHRTHRTLGFGESWFGHRPIFQGRATAGLDATANAVDDFNVLGVTDHFDVTDAGCFGEQIKQVAVIGAIQTQIATFFAFEVHEVLERGHAIGFDVVGQLVDVLLIGGAEVKRIVNVGAGLGVVLFALEHIGIGLVVQKVTQHRGEATLRRVDGLSFVLGDLFAKAEMHMGIDQARKDVQALGRLHRDRGIHRGAWGQMGGDFSISHQQVCGCAVCGGIDQGAAAQDKFSCVHGRLGLKTCVQFQQIARTA